ncbi:MAG: serine/threonine-protein kinase, partial [Myxococcota bacterium]
MTAGAVIAGRFRVSAPLGSGRHGDLFRATDEQTGGAVAVKLLAAALATDPVYVERFRREAAILHKLRDPSLPELVAFGREGDGPIYMVTELVEGPTVRELLQAGPIAPERALRIARQVLGGLSVAHPAGVVHRDLKPENFQIAAAAGGEQAKIHDFGVARVASKNAALTGYGTILGTAAYMSPEQVRGTTVDGRADLYALGCVVYEMLLGEPPFVREGDVKLMVAHMNEEPLPPSQKNPRLRLSPGLEDWLLRALRKNPDDRWKSAQAMAEALDRVLAGADKGRPVAISGEPVMGMRELEGDSKGATMFQLAVDPASLRRPTA